MPFHGSLSSSSLRYSDLRDGLYVVMGINMLININWSYMDMRIASQIAEFAIGRTALNREKLQTHTRRVKGVFFKRIIGYVFAFAASVWAIRVICG